MELTGQFPIHQAQVKRCIRCREEKVLTEFVKQSSLRDGYSSLCKACRRIRDRAAYTPEKGWRNYIKTKFGILPEDYDRMLAAQGGKCAICGRTDSKSLLDPDNNAAHGSINKLHIDHDHETGQIRALLCGTCNRGVGMFLDDPELVEEAARYLRQWKQADDVKDTA